jgi:hypothetical protein
MWNTCKEKEQACWAFIQSGSATDRTEYKVRSAIVKKEVRNINRRHWDQYVTDLE